jgi:tetratricopeptide (TPR) repeat protein
VPRDLETIYFKCLEKNSAKLREEFDAAQARFARAIELLDQTLAEKPNYQLANNTFHGIYYGRAKMHEAMSRDQDALRDWDRCVEYGEEKLRNIAWIGRIDYRIRQRDYDEAIADADQLFAKPNLPGDTLFDLAVV